MSARAIMKCNIYSKITEQERLLKREQIINEKSNFIPPALLKDLQNGYETLKPFPDSFTNEVDEGLASLKRAINHFRKRIKVPTVYLER
jgi:hypothetical protein